MAKHFGNYSVPLPPGIDAGTEAVKAKIVETLKPLAPKERRQVVSSLLSSEFHRAALANQVLQERDALLQRQARVREDLKITEAKLEQRYRQLIKMWGMDTSFKHASDIEILMMAYITLEDIVAEGKAVAAASPAVDIVTGIGAQAEDYENSATYLLRRCERQYMAQYREWGLEWKSSGFARMACGHKLAAALMLTTAPEDVELKAPWKAWSLYIPNGMLVQHFSAEAKENLRKVVDEAEKKYGPDVEVGLNVDLGGACSEPQPGGFSIELNRVWCRGTEPVSVVARMPGSCTLLKPESFQRKSGEISHFATAIRNYVRGVCISLEPSDVETHRKGSWGPKSSKRRTGKEPSGGEYELGAPVTVDLRDRLKEWLHSEGGKGGGKSPSVQFLVRGHWRHQACGPFRADRKWKWIEPFWKGPEEARVLLRAHAVRGDKGPTTPPPPPSPEKKDL